ncbi:allantoate amidohydrolase [Spongisporangium articulatum]|uniref:Allantoate amidohydrolase n=1 Tax=Spongisporangium articulatum TaxID=3362603 RepID=A0ABW8AK87_9ACTN
MSFERRWADLEPLGRAAGGGYRRYAWTSEDAVLREWFAGEADRLGLSLTVDRAGNQWAWWGDPDADGPGVVTGSHLDSVPDGGAFDGPLGVVSALTAVEALQGEGFRPARPLGVVNFADEEGARFGVACAGSRVITGALTPERAAGLTDGDGTALGAAMRGAGLNPDHLGRDDEALRRISSFVELHVEQGRALVDDGSPVGVATAIWPHGRWRFEFLGEANHAGTTRLADRKDPMIDYANAVLAARQLAMGTYDAVATFGKVLVDPNGVNAIPSRVRAWLDARAPEEVEVLGLVTDLAKAAAAAGALVAEESWTGATEFDADLSRRVATAAAEGLGTSRMPLLGTGAGHDAGILAAAGVPAAMLFVRNPTGVSHSPAEFAERDDCLAGVTALTAVLRELAGAGIG